MCMRVCFCMVGNSPVGCQDIDVKLDRMQVLQSQRRKGYGSLVLKFTLQLYCAAGADAIAVPVATAQGRGLYTKNKFVTSECHGLYYSFDDMAIASAAQLLPENGSGTESDSDQPDDGPDEDRHGPHDYPQAAPPPHCERLAPVPRRSPPRSSQTERSDRRRSLDEPEPEMAPLLDMSNDTEGSSSDESDDLTI